MSAVAVFVALGGTAVAVSALPKNSVGPKQIRRNAVDSSKVKDGSLQSGDFAAGVLQAGKQGEKGAPGERGPPGEPGQPATKVYAFIRTGNCCELGLPQLNPPLVLNGHGVTSAADANTGEYEVTFDKSLLPEGNIENCVPLATLGSADASFPMEGTVSVGHPAGIPHEKLLVLYRNSGGNLAVLNNGGGAPGFSIALFC
jgi:hypothetical protein